jgi:hypothetical protein
MPRTNLEALLRKYICHMICRDVATGGGVYITPPPQLWNLGKNQVKFKFKFWDFQVKFA